MAFEGGVLRFVGRGYDGPADEVISGSGMMVMPGLVNIHSHPSSEPMNKGLIDEIGCPGFYNSSLYEYLPIFRADAGGDSALRARGAVGVAAVGRDHAGRSVDGASGMARSAGGGRHARVHRADVPFGALVHEERPYGGIRLGRGGGREGDGRGAVADRARRAASVRAACSAWWCRRRSIPAPRACCATRSPRRRRAACRGRSTRRSRSASSTRSRAGMATRRSAGWIILGCCRSARSSAMASSSTIIRRRAGTPIPM